MRARSAASVRFRRQRSRSLHAQPELGAVAAELARPERHLGGDRLLAAQEAMQGHPADAELTRGLGDRELQAVADDLAEQARPDGSRRWTQSPFRQLCERGQGAI
jgi:hypothetical protein